MRTLQGEVSRRLSRWTLRSLFLLFIPLCTGFASYGYVVRQRQQAVDAFDQMFRKGGDANFSRGLVHSTYIFKDANVNDADLEAFIPAFHGYAPSGFGRIEKFRLNGSPVSDDAVERFCQAVPGCEVER